MSLLSSALKKGLNLQTHTPVHEISDSRTPDSTSTSTGDGGSYWTVSTPRGKILASKIIIATNGYTGAIAPQYATKIIPARGICAHIDVPSASESQKAAPAPHLLNTYALYAPHGGSDYLLPRPDGSIIVGGARTAFFSERKWWYGVVDDGELIEPAANYFDGYMQRQFRGWEDSGTFVQGVWVGSEFFSFLFFLSAVLFVSSFRLFVFPSLLVFFALCISPNHPMCPLHDYFMFLCLDGWNESRLMDTG
jgi:FAD dependent oxidoreductase